MELNNINNLLDLVKTDINNNTKRLENEIIELKRKVQDLEFEEHNYTNFSFLKQQDNEIKKLRGTIELLTKQNNLLQSKLKKKNDDLVENINEQELNDTKKTAKKAKIKKPRKPRAKKVKKEPEPEPEPEPDNLNIDNLNIDNMDIIEKDGKDYYQDINTKKIYEIANEDGDIGKEIL